MQNKIIITYISQEQKEEKTFFIEKDNIKIVLNNRENFLKDDTIISNKNLSVGAFIYTYGTKNIIDKMKQVAENLMFQKKTVKTAELVSIYDSPPPEQKTSWKNVLFPELSRESSTGGQSQSLYNLDNVNLNESINLYIEENRIEEYKRFHNMYDVILDGNSLSPNIFEKNNLYNILNKKEKDTIRVLMIVRSNHNK